MTGHTPQKLPAFAAISCIIAVRAQYPYARSSIIPSFSPFVKDNFRIFYKISIEFLSISQIFLFAHSPFFPVPYSLFPIPSSLKSRPVSPPPPKAPLPKGAGTAGEPPVAFAVTEGFYSRYFFKVQTNVETCHPRNPPGLASPNHPPFARGALGWGVLSGVSAFNVGCSDYLGTV